MSIALFAQQNYEDIAQALRCRLQTLPAPAKTWYALGELYLTHIEDFYGEAIKAFKKAIQIDKNFVLAWEGLGFACRLAGKNKDAMKAFVKATKLNPHNAKTWLGLAQSAVEADAQFYATARNAYHQTLAIDPEQPEIWNEYGNFLNGKINESLAALACYDEVMKRDKGAYWAMYNKGLAYKKLGKYDEAIACYDDCLVVNSSYKQAWDAKGIALLDTRRLDEAKRCFQYNLDNYAYYSNSIYNMGCVFAVEGNKTQALHFLRCSLETQGDYYKDLVARDVDFESLWADADFLELLAQF